MLAEGRCLLEMLKGFLILAEFEVGLSCISVEELEAGEVGSFTRASNVHLFLFILDFQLHQLDGQGEVIESLNEIALSHQSQTPILVNIRLV